MKSKGIQARRERCLELFGSRLNREYRLCSWASRKYSNVSEFLASNHWLYRLKDTRGICGKMYWDKFEQRRRIKGIRKNSRKISAEAVKDKENYPA